MPYAGFSGSRRGSVGGVGITTLYTAPAGQTVLIKGTYARTSFSIGDIDSINARGNQALICATVLMNGAAFGSPMTSPFTVYLAATQTIQVEIIATASNAAHNVGALGFAIENVI